jgi:hypothetical protein
MCHQTVRLMLVKETVRKMRCMDCGQSDPMLSADMQGWLKGELGSKQ